MLSQSGWIPNTLGSLYLCLSLIWIPAIFLNHAINKRWVSSQHHMQFYPCETWAPVVYHAMNSTSTLYSMSLLTPTCAPCISSLSSGVTHVAQGGMDSPWGSQDSNSSRSGHSAPSPTGNWSTCLVRVRLPLGDSGFMQVLVQGLQMVQSVSLQSVGRTHDWMVSGRSLVKHMLGKDKKEWHEILVIS